jgi:hypothetical protein
MDLHIRIEKLEVTSIASSSGIFSGDNRHHHWSAISKTNTGLDLEGDSSRSSQCINIVCDPNFIDTLETTVRPGGPGRGE